MGITDLFSKRQKRLRGDVPDVYTYNIIPGTLRAQVVHIWQDYLGDDNDFYDDYKGTKRAYEYINDTLSREYGVFSLVEDTYDKNKKQQIVEFLLSEKDTERVLDAVELSFKVIFAFARRYDFKQSSTYEEDADKAILELNARFKEHGVGFQFVEGELIRIDSQLIHAEAVVPALRLLSTKGFEGAHQEFLKAYEHFRHHNYKEALNEALKSLESTMKSICTRKGWSYDAVATSKALIETCFKNGLIPIFWQSNMSGLRSLLEGGVPTGRNKLGGHGQGVSPVEVPEHIVAYVLHMTASTILFLAESERDMK